MSNLDNAIKRCKEIELWQAAEAERFDENDGYESYQKGLCLETAHENKQMADWLIELKAYRKFKKQLEADIDKYDGVLICGLAFCYKTLNSILEESENEKD